jgi:hypothetical protein
MARSQVPWAVEAFDATVSALASELKPSYYLVAAEDRMIPPSAQRMMAHRAGATMREVAGSRAITCQTRTGCRRRRRRRHRMTCKN